MPSISLSNRLIPKSTCQYIWVAYWCPFSIINHCLIVIRSRNYNPSSNGVWGLYIYKLNFEENACGFKVLIEIWPLKWQPFSLIFKKSSLKLSEPSPFEQHFINSLRPSDAYSRWTIIGSDNGLSPGRRQAIIWSNAELLLNGPLGTNFSEFFNQNFNIFIQKNAFESVVREMASILSQPQCVNSLWPSHHMATKIWVNIDSDNGLLP